MSSFELKITDANKHISKPMDIKPIERFTPNEKKKLAKATRDFESLLTGMMIKSMTKSTNGMFGGESSYGGDVLDTIFEQEIAQHMSKGNGMGVAKMLYQKMTGEKMPAEDLRIPANRPKLDIKLNQKDATLPSISPSTSSMNRLQKFDPFIDAASKKFGVPKNIIKSIILTESAAKDKAVSKANAKGLMQLMDATAKDMGVKNSFDPEDNILGGTRYISQMLKKYDGDMEKSLAAYNAGPGNVDKYGGIPPFEETQNYVKRVLGYLNHFEG